MEDNRTALHKFLDEWDGSIQCGCDHGCNQWLARNAAKMRYITMELLLGNRAGAEKAAGMDAQGLAQDLHNKTVELARRERKKPLEQQEHSLWSRILKKG